MGSRWRGHGCDCLAPTTLFDQFDGLPHHQYGYVTTNALPLSTWPSILPQRYILSTQNEVYGRPKCRHLQRRPTSLLILPSLMITDSDECAWMMLGVACSKYTSRYLTFSRLYSSITERHARLPNIRTRDLSDCLSEFWNE